MASLSARHQIKNSTTKDATGTVLKNCITGSKKASAILLFLLKRASINPIVKPNANPHDIRIVVKTAVFQKVTSKACTPSAHNVSHGPTSNIELFTHILISCQINNQNIMIPNFFPACFILFFLFFYVIKIISG